MVAAIHFRKSILFICALAAIGAGHWGMAMIDFASPAPALTTLRFLDVGQGDATLVEQPDGRRILIDGGGAAAGRFLGLRDESTFSIGEDVVSAYLFGRRFRRIDVLVLTHAHFDHLDGLRDVIENFEVGEVWLGRNPMVPIYRDFLERVMAKQVPIRWVSAGDRIGLFEVLHPPAHWRVRRAAGNDDSVVLLVDTGKSTALLTGDIEQTISAPRRVDVYKLPHHGSRGVRLRVEAPIRVVSVGANNPFGHPHPSVGPALRTDRWGLVTVVLE
jgi:competence protein ComEC